jgi:hypothetical protein
VRLLGFDYAEIRLREGLQPEWREQHGQLAQLAGVVRRDDDLVQARVVRR